ncbi:MAG: SDR family NAD(P)-dependent oxidoreductase [Candidatus Puniceispirillaceae bacterium]
MKLTDQISAVVTGGASGLGEAVVRYLRSKQVKTALFDRDDALGQQVADETGSLFVKVDVSDAASVRQGFEEARQIQGQERLVVNCAGIAPAMKTVSRGTAHDPDVFAKVISINLIGSFQVASIGAEGMVSTDPVTTDGERGVIINTASVAAFDGQIGQSAYAASKAAVAGMTLPMARDLADKGIRVVSVAPGIFATPMLTAFPQEVQDALAAQIPFPARLGKPEEFAELVGHIAENEMLNGETIRLDGAIRMPPR